jgi:uncharacterized membrane protein
MEIAVMRRRGRSRLPTWQIPAIYAVTAIVVGLVLPRLESAVLGDMRWGLSPNAAVAIFSSVGSGMIAMTGIVFSLAFVMVQFSATAYSPRIVMWLARDPVLWHAVGVFSATFLYALFAIAWVDRAGGGNTPFVSTWLVFGLLLASVGMFIALIEKLTLLQIHRMLAFTADHGRRVVDETYPPLESPAALCDPDEYARLPLVQTLKHVGRPAALQALDVPALLALASGAQAVIVVTAAVGDTLVEGMPMAEVRDARTSVDEALLRAAFLTGEERTFEQDPKYAIRLLVDIAIRALSPAVNDPTTAVQALAHIEDLLRRLGNRRLEIGAHRDGSGALRVVVPHPSWENFLDLAFDEIRHYGADSVQVMRRMKALVPDLLAAVPVERWPAVRHHERRVDAAIARAFPDEEEKAEASVEDRQGLGSPRTP